MINGDCHHAAILVTEQSFEDIKCVMPVVSKQERMDYGVVVNNVLYSPKENKIEEEIQSIVTSKEFNVVGQGGAIQPHWPCKEIDKCKTVKHLNKM